MRYKDCKCRKLESEVSLDQAQSPSHHLGPGAIFDEHYRIVCHLGAGGWANVYQAVHLHMDKPVAIKLLRRSMCDDNRKVRRFQREAKATAAIKNRNLINIQSFGIFHGTPYLVMDYVEGYSLDSILSVRGKLARAEVISIGQQLCSALEGLHDHGIIHRDIKPANVLLTADGECKLVDFGVAKLQDWDADEPTRPVTESLTATGTFLGTPGYMSPEQAASGTLDGRSDLYSVGCLLFELLTGRTPYEAETHYAMLSQHMYADLPSLSSVDPAYVRDGLDEVVQTCLAKLPDDRFQKAQDLSDALGACADGSLRPVRRSTGSRALSSWVRGPEMRGLANLFVLSASVLALMVAVCWQSKLPDSKPEIYLTPHDLIRRSLHALVEKDYPTAERDLKSALVQIRQLPPGADYQRSFAELRLGQTLLDLHDPQQALTYFHSAAEAANKVDGSEKNLSPLDGRGTLNNRLIFAGLGECYAKLGQPRLSAYWYERAVLRDPNCGCDTWVHMGASMYRAGRYQEISGEKFPWEDENCLKVIYPQYAKQLWGAIPVLRHASKLAEEDGRAAELFYAQDMLAASLTRMRRYPEAEVVVERMIELGASSRTSRHEAQNRLSNLRLSQGRLDEARKVSEALLIDCDIREERALMVDVYAQLGIILYKQKHYRQAAGYFDKAYQEMQKSFPDHSVRGKAEGHLDSILWLKKGRDSSLVQASRLPEFGAADKQ